MSEPPPFPASVNAWPPRFGKIFATCRWSGCSWHTEVAEAEIDEAAWRHAEMHEIRCSHENAVPVESNGETIAALCPDCNLQLSAAWLACDHVGTSVDVTGFGESAPFRRACAGCGVVFQPDPPAPELRLSP